MFESQNKEKKDSKKNQKSGEHKKGKLEKDLESSSNKTLPNKRKQKTIHGESKIQTRQVKEGMDTDDHVQQGIPNNTTSIIIDLSIESLDNKKEKTQIERPEEQKEIPQTQQQGQDNINGEFEINIITSKDNLPNNIDDTLQENNIDSGSKLSTSVEKDENYYRLRQGIPRSTKFRSVVDIYKHTNRLSSLEDEYNWSRPNILENKNSEVHIEGKTGKDQEGTFEATLPNKQKQKAIHGEFESLSEDSPTNNSNRTLMENNVDNTNDQKDEDCHITEGTSNDTMFDSLLDASMVLQNEISEEHNVNNIRKDQKDSFEEESPDQQQQQQDINGESELNSVACDASRLDNSNRILNDNSVNYGSKLWARDEKDGNYRIMQGIPRSIKFRSINNLYQCTNSLSSVEDEFNWNLSIKEDPNMNLSTKEDSSINTNKKNATTSST